MRLQSKINNILIIWLFTAIYSISTHASDIEYYADQDTRYPNIKTVINHPNLKNYLSKPDTVNLQLIYGWGRDIGLKNPDVGFWIADTLLSLAQAYNDHRAVISAYSLKAQMYHQQADIYNSIKNYKNAIRYGENNLDYNTHPNYDKLGINYAYLGDLYYDMNDMISARKYYGKAWDILSKITDVMINNQNKINSKLDRAYTTLAWDRAYSKLKLAMIYSESDSNYSAGIDMLKEIYNNTLIDDVIIKINAGFYIGLATYDKQNPINRKYIKEAYLKAKLAKLYNLQSEIGLAILESKLLDDLMLENQIISDLKSILYVFENVNHKYRFYRLLSEFDNDIQQSLLYLDSAYTYRELHYNQENLRRIGKVQSDIEYLNQLEISKRDEQSAQNNLTIVFIAMGIFLVIVVLLLYLLLQRKKLLYELSTKNKKISIQNSRLANQITSREELIGILGHDIRIPILGIRLSTQNLIDTVTNGDINGKLIELERSVSELEDMLNSILNYAESNLYFNESDYVAIDLEELIETTKSMNQDLIKQKNLSFITDLKVTNLESNLFIVTSAVSNIISNAAKFSYQDSTVKVSIYSEDTFTIIKTEDSGVGININDLKKIRSQIKPKVQDAINAPTGNGFGLLTTISQLDKIGANVFIESEVGVGTTVLIYLNS